MCLYRAAARNDLIVKIRKKIMYVETAREIEIECLFIFFKVEQQPKSHSM